MLPVALPIICGFGVNKLDMKRDFNGGILPSKKKLLRQRILPIGDYANELTRGSKFTKPICAQLYGSKVTPIPVPMTRHESLASYEERFREWLLSEKKSKVENLKENPIQERNYRLYFARMQVRDYKVPMNRSISPKSSTESILVSFPDEEVEVTNQALVDSRNSALDGAVDGSSERSEIADDPSRKKRRVGLNGEHTSSDIDALEGHVVPHDQVVKSREGPEMPSESEIVQLVLLLWKNHVVELEALLKDSQPRSRV